jgi:hypothetical protein
MEYDHIDPEEVDDLNQDIEEHYNPNVHQQNNNKEVAQPDNPEQIPDAMIVSDAEDENSTATESTRRSTRETKPIERLEPAMTGKPYAQQKIQVTFKADEEGHLEYCHNLVVQTKPDPSQSKEYNPQDAMLLARLIYDLNNKVAREGALFAQQYLLNKGLKVFGQKGHDASMKEMDQLHRRSCFTPASIKKMIQAERKKLQVALMFLGEKRDGTIKGRMVYTGKPTREWLSREDSASPTAALESIMLTAVIDAHEGRDVMTCDIPNAFIQALMPEVKDGDESNDENYRSVGRHVNQTQP